MDFIRYYRKKKLKSAAGFTLIEICIAVVVVAILAALASVYYYKVIGKSEDSEALVNLAAIKRAEFTKQAETGTFVNASDTSEVNEKLGSVDIQEKIFKYKVVNATQEDFVAVAERILGAGNVTIKDKPIEIAMYSNGGLSYTYSSGTPGSGSGPAGIGLSGGSGAAGSGSSGAGGLSGGGGFSGGGGGGSSGGGGGSSGGSSGGGGGSSGGSSGGGGESGDGSADGSQVVDVGLADALETLKSSTIGLAFYNLIFDKSISVIYEDMSGGVLAYWLSSENKIAINSLLSAWTQEALAAEIAHEALHADYTYNGQKWVDDTLQRHPELTEGDLHIITPPYYSLDQEYMANYYQVAVWKELKGSQTNSILDAKESRMDQGEDFVKAYLRTIPGYSMLPDY